MYSSYLLANIESAALPALRIVSVVAILMFAAIGAWIFRGRHHLFDADPDIPTVEDSPAIHHVRLELVLIVWGALMLLMLVTCYEIWVGA